MKQKQPIIVLANGECAYKTTKDVSIGDLISTPKVYTNKVSQFKFPTDNSDRNTNNYAKNNDGRNVKNVQNQFEI
jgi:hypothetical protein